MAHIEIEQYFIKTLCSHARINYIEHIYIVCRVVVFMYTKFIFNTLMLVENGTHENDGVVDQT